MCGYCCGGTPVEKRGEGHKGCSEECYNAPKSKTRRAVPAPEPRGVAEVKAEALREAASSMLVTATSNRDRSHWRATAWANWLRDRADRIVRDAHPAEDSTDCCRERTTAGGCGCGGGS